MLYAPATVEGRTCPVFEIGNEFTHPPYILWGEKTNSLLVILPQNHSVFGLNCQPSKNVESGNDLRPSKQ